MKTNVDLFAFRDEMTRDRYSFSWEGATALYDYFMDLEEDTGKEMEFDPIAISCDFSEYENLQEVLEGCSILNLNFKTPLRNLGGFFCAVCLRLDFFSRHHFQSFMK